MAVVTLLIALVRSAFGIPNLVVVYLLPVMFCAVTWGWWSALATALLAFLTYDFFFTEPVFTLHVAEPHEWVALLIFLAVAAVTSNLAARERARREQAGRQVRTATFLYEIGRALGGGNDLDGGLRDVAERLVAELRLDGVVIATSQPSGKLTPRVAVGSCGAALGSAPAGRLFRPSLDTERAGRWLVVRSGEHGPAPAARDPVASFPLRRAGRELGLLRLCGRRDGFADDEARLLAAVADRVAVALEQERLGDEANRAEVLRRTDALRTALLASVSHDLRTPLAAIKACAESLLQTDVAWTQADRDGFAGAIQREADRLNRLVANLLDMSRIEGGGLRPQRDWYDLGELVREVLARLGPLLDGRPLRLTVADDLAPVALDYLMIDQVVTNLLENAVKHTPPGSPILVDVRPTPAGLCVAVEDRGPGIPPEHREHVFDKFVRLDVGERGRGSGLGLAIAHELVERMNGELVVESQPGRTTFTLDLPA